MTAPHVHDTERALSILVGDAAQPSVAVLETPGLTAATRTAAGTTVVPPGCATVRHVHPECDEGLYVIAGGGILLCGEGVTDLYSGALTVIPAGTYHSVRNETAQALRLVWWYAPDGPEARLLAPT